MKRRNTYRDLLRNGILVLMLSMISVTAQAADDNEIIEFQGDRYVIHVDRMNPDSEMSLLDVLNTCPEFLSLNGKKIDQNYKLRTDNIDLIVDPESFLANVKACEIDRIQICSNTSVAKAVNGTKGVIDIYYRQDVKTDGKVALTGSTYGNGMLYTDVTNQSEKLAMHAYGLVRSSYGKAYPNDVYKMTDRTLAENLYLSLDWRMSASDRLIIKAYQKFFNSKQKLFNPGLTGAFPYYDRYVGLVLSSHLHTRPLADGRLGDGLREHLVYQSETRAVSEDRFLRTARLHPRSLDADARRPFPYDELLEPPVQC